MENLKNGTYTPEEFYEICENANIDLCDFLSCEIDNRVVATFENGNRTRVKAYNKINDKIIIRIYETHKNDYDETDISFIITDNTKDFEEI